MRDRFPLLFFSLSVIGLALIYSVAGNIEPKNYEISLLDNSMVGEYVSVIGYVESADFANKNIAVTLSDGNSNINVVIFEDLKNAFGSDAYSIFSKGSVISVKGVVDEYKGLLEIIPNRISDVKRMVK
ncbi:MAG: OB-fold nucleic acid binding domain-containing protein [Candidatus Aenigmatarchaeota archaeon]